MTNFLETARKMSPGTESCLDSCRDTFFACWIDSLRLKFWKRKTSIIFLHRIAGTYSQLYLASRRIACEIHATEDAHSCKKNGEKKLPKFNVWANANEVSLMVARRQHTSEQFTPSSNIFLVGRARECVPLLLPGGSWTRPATGSNSSGRTKKRYNVSLLNRIPVRQLIVYRNLVTGQLWDSTLYFLQ